MRVSLVCFPPGPLMHREGPVKPQALKFLLQAVYVCGEFSYTCFKWKRWAGRGQCPETCLKTLKETISCSQESRSFFEFLTFSRTFGPWSHQFSADRAGQLVQEGAVTQQMQEISMSHPPLSFAFLFTRASWQVLELLRRCTAYSRSLEHRSFQSSLLRKANQGNSLSENELRAINPPTHIQKNVCQVCFDPVFLKSSHVMNIDRQTAMTISSVTWEDRIWLPNQGQSRLPGRTANLSPG